MKPLPATALILALAASLTAFADNPDAGAPQGDGWKAVDLTYVPCPKDFPFTAFEGAPVEVSGSVLKLPTKDGGGVVVAPEEFAIGVDVNGDGKVDDRLKSDGATCSVVVTYADGFSAPYMVKFARNRAKKWTYERSGYWKGTVNKEPVAVFDNNNDGMYDGLGKDGLAVGTSGYATPLSRVVSLGGALFELHVAPSGRRFWVRDFKGETGKLDAVSGYKTQGKLLAAVFKSGDIAINVVGKDKACLVPAGKYELVGGEVGASSGSQKATIRKGTMAAVDIAAGGSASVTWGMDLHLTFACNVDKGTLTIKGLDVKAFGAGGEEYADFRPIQLTPDLNVWAGTGTKPLLQGGLSICPQGTLDDFHGPVGTATGPLRIQLSEKKFAKMFGEFSSEVKEIK